MTGWRRLVLSVVGAVAILVVAATPASAHNALLSTTPTADQTVSRTPAQVVLRFNEPAIALGTQLVVTGPNGQAQQGSAELVDNTVAQPLQPGSPAGAYTVVWRVTSIDGHPISGTFTFTADAAGAGEAPASTPTPASTPVEREATGVPGWIWLAAGLLVLGTTMTVLWRLRRRGL